MTDTLFIHLSSPAPEGSVSASVVSSDGAVVRAAYSTTLATLAETYRGVTVVGLIPGAEALTTVVSLPKVRSRALRKMLPFALEEQIAGELDRQHFAVGAALGTSTQDRLELPVTAIRRESLEAYLHALRAVGFEPAALYLDESCIAAKPGDVVAWNQGDELFLRAPSGAGLRCRATDLSTVTDLLPTDAPLSSLGLQIVELPKSATTQEVVLDDLKSRYAAILRVRPAEHFLDWLVAQHRLAAPINLLQGEHAPRRARFWSESRWRLPAALAAALLLLITIDRAYTWRSAALEEATLDATISAGGVTPQSATRPATDAPLRRALADLANAGLRNGALVAVIQESDVIRVTLSQETPREPLVRALSMNGWRIDSGSDDQGRPVLTLISAQR
ncbi:MAG: type II secretion system protein GspL [Steroidobacteraceae bacterium]